MFKTIFKALGKVLTWLSPFRQTAQAALLRAIAADLVRAWFQKHPDAKAVADQYIAILSQLLADAGGVSYETAERVIRSAVQTQLTREGKTDAI